MQFIFSEGTRYISSYRVVERPGPDAFSVVWVIPRMAESDFRLVADALRQCLKWKRPNDLWWVLLDKSSAQFTADDAKIEAVLQAPPKDVQCDDIAVTISRASQEGNPVASVMYSCSARLAATKPRHYGLPTYGSFRMSSSARLTLARWRYEITYRPVSAFPVPIRLRVQTSQGWTETVLPASGLPLPIHRKTHQGTNR